MTVKIHHSQEFMTVKNLQDLSFYYLIHPETL